MLSLYFAKSLDKHYVTVLQFAAGQRCICNFAPSSIGCLDWSLPLSSFFFLFEQAFHFQKFSINSLPDGYVK